MTFQHRFYGRFPLVLWTLEQTFPPAGIVARGTAWIDALPSSYDEYLAQLP